MTTKRKATTAKGVEALVNSGEAGQYSAGSGLYLKVSGKKKGSWFYRYKINGKTRRMGLGSTEIISLGEARKLVNQHRLMVSQGKDPLAEREAEALKKEAERITFDMVAADYIESQRQSWTNEKHAQQWENTLATYASPVIGDLAPAEITTEHLLEILKPIWNTKTETASRVRNRIELVLNAAKARKLRSGENVAAWRGHLELLLTKHSKKKPRHHPALPWSQVNDLWQALAGHQDTAADALRLTILTATRSSEVFGAHWSEFDLEAAVWTIPANRMKAKEEHRVPLSRAAMALLEQIPKVPSGLLFEGRKEGKPVSNMVMLNKVRRMDKAKRALDGIGWRDHLDQVITPHGFRSTFRDWAAETTHFQNIVVEQALAHTIGNAVESSYRRGDLLGWRRELMEAWGNYVTMTPLKNVTPLRKKGQI